MQGVLGGSSSSFNPCPYANNNPVNYTDPTGEFPWLLVGLFLLGGGIDVGSQMAFEGKSFDEVNWLRAGISGGTTVIGGAAGIASATLIKQAGLTGGRALLAAGIANAVDFGAGLAADHYLLGDSWGTAVAGNAIGFGIGEFAGFAGKGAIRLGGDLLAGTLVGRGIQSFDRRLAQLGEGIFGLQFAPDTGGRLHIAQMSSYHQPELPNMPPRRVPLGASSTHTATILTEVELEHGVDYPISVRSGDIDAEQAVRRAHNQAANQKLYEMLQSDRVFREQMSRNYPEVTKHVLPTRNNTWRGTSPPSWTWHHDPINPGNMQLVWMRDHQAFSGRFHIKTRGGFNIWGIIRR